VPDDWGIDETRTSHGDEAGTLRYSEDERAKLAAQVWAKYAPPPQIGPYQIGERLGRGGMARVHLGTDPRTGRRVAVKFLAPSPGVTEDPEGVARFSREAEALAKLSAHRGIVTIESAGQTSSGLPYLVMELVEGPTLRTALREGLPRDAALDHLETVAEALSVAHKHGILHRDVKPANVLLAADGARLADFGLARLIQSDQRLTRTGDVLGTPAYMAPEQASPELGATGPWTDVWALGIVLHEVLVGHPPFRGSSYEIFSQLVRGEPIEDTRSGEGRQRTALDEVCRRALTRPVEERLPDAGVFLSELRAARAGGPAPAEGGGRRRGAAMLVVTLLVGALGGGALVGLLQRDAAAPSEPSSSDQEPDAERLGELQRRWEAHDTLAARELLRVDDDVPARPWLLAFSGDAQQALESALSPPELARLAAWAGDLSAAEAALERVEPARARALRWSLRGLLPLRVEEAPLDTTPLDGWSALARAAEAEGRGRLASAEGDLLVLRGAEDPALRFEAWLGLARLALSRGEGERAAEHLLEALAEVSSPLDRARVVGLAALAEVVAGASLPALVDAFGGSVASHAKRYAPAQPWAALALLEAGRRRAPPDGWDGLAQARRAAAAGAREGLQQLGGEGRSFVEAELRRCEQGDDGLPGLLIARAARLAELAELGNDRAAAERARGMAEAAVRLRPASALAFCAWARALRVLRGDDAVERAEQALTRAAHDDRLLLELARARLAEAEASFFDWAVARLQEQPAGTRRLLAGLEAAAEAFEAVQGDSREAAALGRLATLALRYRVLLELGRDASAASAQLESVREPLLASVPIEALGEVRTALAAGLLDDPAQVAAAEARLLDLSLAVDAPARAALRVGAVGSRGPELLRAYLALEGDLPVRSLLALRAAEQGPEGADRVRALALAAGLPFFHAQLIDLRLAGEGWSALRDPSSLANLVRAIAAEPAWVGLALGAVSRLSLSERARQRLEQQLSAELDQPDLQRLAALLLRVGAAPHGLTAGSLRGQASHAREACALAEALLRERPEWVAPRLLLAAATSALARGGAVSGEACWQLRLAQAAAPTEALARLWLLRLRGEPLRGTSLQALAAQGYLEPSRWLPGLPPPDWLPAPEAVRAALADDTYGEMDALLGDLDDSPDGWALAFVLRLLNREYWAEVMAEEAPGAAPASADLASLREAEATWRAWEGLEGDLTRASAVAVFEAGLEAVFGRFPGGRLERWGQAPPPRWPWAYRSEPMRQAQADVVRLREAWLGAQESGAFLGFAHQGWRAVWNLAPPPVASQADLDGLFGVGPALAASPRSSLVLQAATPSLQDAQDWLELSLHYDRLAALRAGPDLVWTGAKIAEEIRVAAYVSDTDVAREAFLRQGLALVRRLRALGAEGPALGAQALDLQLDLAGFLADAEAQERALARARVELLRVAATKTLPTELTSQTAWRRVRAWVALGEVERALEALADVERALEEEGLPAPDTGVLWSVQGDPLRHQLDAVPQVAALLRRLEAK
jgi:hypothetical protein